MWWQDRKAARGDDERRDDSSSPESGLNDVPQADVDVDASAGFAGQNGQSVAHESSPDVRGSGSFGFETDSIADAQFARVTTDRWMIELAGVGGTSPLLHFEEDMSASIDISQSHPGGLPPFISGKATLLSNLIRDELALRGARAAAETITQKGIDLRSVRGIDAIHLAIGVAEWQFEGATYRAPLLLRPMAIRRYGRDFELKLKGGPFLNPALARALRDQFNIGLDAHAFVALATQTGIFKPQPVIDRLRGLTSHLEWFSVSPRLVISSFAEVGTAMAADVGAGQDDFLRSQRLQHPIISAVAGNHSAEAAINVNLPPIDRVSPDVRPPQTDNLLLDADTEQEEVIAHIVAGESLVVHTLPGTGGTQTVVNAIGALVAQHKRVLVVSPRMASLDGIAARLHQLKLPSVAVTLERLRRDLIQSISRNEQAKPAGATDVDEALIRLRKVLLEYRKALAVADPELGISVVDALGELAKLSILPQPPKTAARLERSALVALANRRAEAATALVRAAELGQFRYGPDDSPWYGASFNTPEAATAAHELAKRLNHQLVPQLIDAADAVIGQTRLRRFESIAELGLFLRLLTDVRETLDSFQPSVFDRSLQDVIEATGPKRTDMKRADRRRLKRLAYEYVRPGVSVPNIHDWLVRIQQQRTLWQRYSATGAIPSVPTGIAEVHNQYHEVSALLAELDGPLGVGGTERALGTRPLRDLTYTLSGLAAESEVLKDLHERTRVLSTLNELQLEPLLRDLANRHVPGEQVAAELELAWWQSALEGMLVGDKALLGANTSVLERLEADFRLVDEAHASSGALQLAWALAESWRLAVVDWPEEAEALRRMLKAERLSLPALQESAPHLLKVLAPAWLSSPYLVHRIEDGIDFDAVFILDAAATSFAENLGAIRRAKQVVAFGDPVTQKPSAFDIGVRLQPTTLAVAQDEDLVGTGSVFDEMARIVPTLTLTRSYRAGGEDLAQLVNSRFYDGKIDAYPWAGSFLGHGSLNIHTLDATGSPDPISGSVESLDVEVAKVVELVTEHALTRPRESLMVVTASERHQGRVQQAVLAAFAKRSDMSEFFLKDRAEPFTVLTLEQATAQSRDRVVFSVGFGRTPHGRLLSDFGALSGTEGERLLAVAMTRARRSLDVVACFRPEDIDPERQAAGVVALAAMLSDTAAREAQKPVADTRDPMLIDLAKRLESRGITVSLGHDGKLALAAKFGAKAVVVETDPVLVGMSLREGLRLRPGMLRRLGWHYIRVHSFDLFANPEAVVERVCKVLGLADA